MDLAIAHFVNNMLAFLQQKNICLVPKDISPSCVALLQPVEDFRATFQKAIDDGGKEATSILGLKRSIKEKARQILPPTILSGP